MWIVEHLYRHTTMARFNPERFNRIKDYEERLEKYKCPEGVRDWDKLFCSLTANKITWNLPWFPWRQVIHSFVIRPFLLLMGIRDVQPYVPLRVLRQLGRCQIISIIENMTEFVFEVRLEIPLSEELVQQIWEGCRIMGIEMMVIELEKVEVHPDYHEWEKIDEQQREFAEEKAKSADIEVALRGQIKLDTTRGSHIAELAASHRQQLQEVEKNMQEEFDKERSQWIREREILREQLEVVSACEQHAKEIVDFRDRQSHKWDQAFSFL
ncbi:hypothetical protein FXO38_28606 [Capsicum annuum]|nr:hypothetical protein FXO38_28606 [Capsicum annuum]